MTEREHGLILGDSITLERVRTDDAFNLVSLLNDDTDDTTLEDSPYYQYPGINSCEYYDPDQFAIYTKELKKNTSFFHLNCQGLRSNWDNFQTLMCDISTDNFSFDFIGISEVFRCDNEACLSLPGYHTLITRTRDDDSRGGVGLFIRDKINYKIREDLSVFIPHVIESLFIEIDSNKNNPSIIGVIYRPNTPPRADVDIFSSTVCDLLDQINRERQGSVIMGDCNIDLLKCYTHIKTTEYIDHIFSRGFLPVITKPTRVCVNDLQSSATLIDNIFTNNMSSSSKSGVIINDVADHFGIFYIILYRIMCRDV